MIRGDVINKYDGGEIFLDFFRDKRMILTTIIFPNTKNDSVVIRTYADLEELTAAEMRDLWNELKKPYISPPEIMERIRADVLEYLQNIGRTDLVAVCLDNAAYGEVAMRL